MNIMLKALSIISILLAVSVQAAYSQTLKKNPNDEEAAQRLSILNDLKALAADSKELLKPLAQAAAKAEIADASWSLDADMAKQLLREAYQLTLPTDDERKKSGSQTSGAPILLTKEIQARIDVRQRILSIAFRDNKFAEELQRQDDVAKNESAFVYARLAGAALNDGDKASASQFVIKGFEANPVQGAATDVINDLAVQDRAAADKLILKYIESLEPITLSSKNQSALLVYHTFFSLMYPNDFFGNPNKPVPPPGPAVMRAYAIYVAESLRRMEQNEPGSVKSMRGLLMSAWLPLKQYAPELTSVFLDLERLSRTPGQDALLPTPESEKAEKERYEKRLRDAAESDTPDDRTINILIGNGDFDKARKLIDKLPDGPRRDQNTEKVNLKEALSLAAKGDITDSALLAEHLTKVASLSQIYPVIIKDCAGKKDAACVTNLGLQAMKQLEKADTTPFAPPAGIPAASVAKGQESDLIPKTLAKLVKTVAPLNEVLAFEMLDRMVSASNKSEMDTGLGRVGFDGSVFKSVAAINEPRARQEANSLDDKLTRIAALAAVSKWKADMLSKATSLRPSEPATAK